MDRWRRDEIMYRPRGGKEKLILQGIFGFHPEGMSSIGSMFASGRQEFRRAFRQKARRPKKEAVRLPAGEGPNGNRPREKGLRSPTARILGSSDAEIHWGVSRPPITEKRMKRPGFAQGEASADGDGASFRRCGACLGYDHGIFRAFPVLFRRSRSFSRSIDSHLERNPAPGGECGFQRTELAFPLPI